MHEMSITVNVINIVTEQMEKNNASRLNTLRVRVGQLTSVEPDALRFCFEACIKDTPLEGAVLEIEEVSLMGRCGSCKRNFRMEDYFISTCPHCGGTAEDIISGRELDIVSMEVD